MTTATPPQPAHGRLVSLDAFRGATIMAMILVNNPGTWAHVYAPLLHAEWHGWTPTDLVFPFFLFIAGVAIPLALGPRIEAGTPRRALLGKAAKRGAILFALGLFMAFYPGLRFPLISDEPGVALRAASWEKLRIMGVLQRIGLCYFAAAALYLYLPRRRLLWATAALLLISWALLVGVPVPEYGAGELDIKAGNVGAWIDRAVLGSNHLWAGANREWDPEGLFGTLNATATTLFGVLAGLLLRSGRNRTVVTTSLFATGVVLLSIGYAWSWALPLNKALWTSSYAVFTAGQAFLLFGLSFWWLDAHPDPSVRERTSRWARPFVIYGLNALTVFFFSGLLAKTLILIRVPLHFTHQGAFEATNSSVWAWIYQAIFAPLPLAPKATSLLFALTWIGFWFLILRWMAKRDLIWKV